MTLFLERSDGRLAYDDTGGSGPLVVAVPGVGDLRTVYRHLTPRLAAAGYRVATMDLRGAGESSVEWDDVSDAAIAGDITALIDHLDAGHAVIVGNSLGAASAVIAATERPDATSAVVLIGPFVRDLPTPAWMRLGFKAMLSPPWGRWAWVTLYRKRMYPAAPPPDHADQVARLAAALAEPGRFRAFRRLAFNSHAEAGSRLDRLQVPALVVMGTADPDFADPVGEARLVTDRVGGTMALVDDAGHYPQAEFPEVVAGAIVEFLADHHVA
jgi:pimeloyl-ACP methyl ester carboxylesterase